MLGVANQAFTSSKPHGLSIVQINFVSGFDACLLTLQGTDLAYASYAHAPICLILGFGGEVGKVRSHTGAGLYTCWSHSVLPVTTPRFPILPMHMQDCHPRYTKVPSKSPARAVNIDHVPGLIPLHWVSTSAPIRSIILFQADQTCKELSGIRLLYASWITI